MNFPNHTGGGLFLSTFVMTVKRAETELRTSLFPQLPAKAFSCSSFSLEILQRVPPTLLEIINTSKRVRQGDTCLPVVGGLASSDNNCEVRVRRSYLSLNNSFSSKDDSALAFIS
ncbi:hypothetical protein PTKIN_Ptkin06aG0004200 [Pterospermum kingtungense]